MGRRYWGISQVFLLAVLLALTSGEARAASAGVSELAEARPASAAPAEARPMGSSASPYVYVAAGFMLALILVVASVKSSDSECKFAAPC